MAEPNYLTDPQALIATGVLAEINRRMLHPLGMALEVNQDEDTGEVILRVWDDRGDPEGTIYGSPGYGPELVTARHEAFEQLWAERAPAREARYGWMVQPVDVDGGNVAALTQ